MDQSIIIAYPDVNTLQIKVCYTIDTINDLQTINCNIDLRQYPLWLQLRKFSISSRILKGSYMPLYNEVNNSKNMDTTLFIDLVYSGIMRLEGFNVYEPA